MNKQFHLNPWFAFAVLCACVIFGIFANSIPFTAIFLFGAVIALPNKKFQAWLQVKKNQAVHIGKGLAFIALFLLIAGGAFWIGAKFVNGIGSYEGQNAEYWFNEYDTVEAENEELQTKINNYQEALQEANDNIENVNSEIRSAKYMSGESYYDMEDALDSLNAADTVSEPD